MTRRRVLSQGLMLGALPLLDGIAREGSSLPRVPDPAPDMGTVVCDIVRTLLARGVIGADPEDYSVVLREPGSCGFFCRTGQGEGAVRRIMEEIVARDAPRGGSGKARAAIVVFSGDPSPSLPEVSEAMELFDPVVDEEGSILFSIGVEPQGTAEGLFWVPPDPGSSRISVALLGVGGPS